MEVMADAIRGNRKVFCQALKNQNFYSCYFFEMGSDALMCGVLVGVSESA
jgi:hypothetical protein